MLFQEIMRLEPFEGATVLVGDTRGEHQVKAVYVSDGSNIPEKAERGGAFFVCDTAFGDKNNKEFDDNLKKYIDCLTDKQAAGLIIEKHTEMAEITEDIVLYAAKKGIPLIIIPYETAVTQAVPQLYYSLFEDRNRQDESNLFMKELSRGENHFFTQNDIRDDVVEKFINDIAEVYVDENRVLDCRKAILSPIAEKLSVNEKLLYLYEFDLENEFEVDLDTGKVTEIK